nr:type I phosphomannose isomerase catalytic subunit [Paraflavitalea speifideiaquila]
MLNIGWGHDNAPADLIDAQGQKQALNAWVAQDPVAALGKVVNDRFGRLPYLFKVLDVKDMLSIQVHPEKKAAVEAFAAENKQGVALTAPNRNYKDDNHKPELMLALSDFWLLHGFKPADPLKRYWHKYRNCNSCCPSLAMVIMQLCIKR